MLAISDPRYVDFTMQIESAGLTMQRVKQILGRVSIDESEVLRCSLLMYVFGTDDLGAHEDLIIDRHTPQLMLYVFEETTGAFLVHIGALEEVCRVLEVGYPRRAAKARMVSIKRPDAHLGQRRDAATVDKMMMQMQNFEQLIGDMEVEERTCPAHYAKRSAFVRDILALEINIMAAKLA